MKYYDLSFNWRRGLELPKTCRKPTRNPPAGFRRVSGQSVIGPHGTSCMDLAIKNGLWMLLEEIHNIHLDLAKIWDELWEKSKSQIMMLHSYFV